ncbi:MAG: hypothetical protein ACYCZN_02600 [Candidatus Dormibacteria bacterium]
MWYLPANSLSARKWVQLRWLGAATLVGFRAGLPSVGTVGQAAETTRRHASFAHGGRQTAIDRLTTDE